MSKIIRELSAPPVSPPALDQYLFDPSSKDLEFLRAKISNDDAEIRRRVFEVQKESYESYPYPCIRAFHFVSLMMSANHAYGSVIERGRMGKSLFLDLGCCMGSDVRKLVSDGYPASQIIGCDLRPEFIALGHKLYRDAGTCPIAFFSSDIFDVSVEVTPAFQKLEDLVLANVRTLGELRGRLSHLYTGALFHLFDGDTQHAIALRLAVLVKHETGTVLFGRHQGKDEAGTIDDHLGRLRYGHSPATWARMWTDVFTELESAAFARERVVVKAELVGRTLNGIPMAQRTLYWSVAIIAPSPADSK